MEMINNLQIDNYKSIKHLSLDCNRINVLIGEPNVGKSNILEALDLSYLSWMFAGNESKQKANKEPVDIKKYFRVNTAADLFQDGDISKTISISSSSYLKIAELRFKWDDEIGDNIGKQKNYFEVIAGSGFTRFNNDFIPIEPIQFYSSNIVPYRYMDNIEFHDIGNYIDKLMPPFGNNLSEVIKRHSEFRELIGELIQDFGLELNVDSLSNNLFFQRKVSPGVVYSLCYDSLADTLRRIIFYVAAIRYNNGHVLTLEEPDAHSFPKFVSFLADEIIQNNKNQFFIATHSPYLLNNLIENTPSDELGVFVCGFGKERGTTARKLSTEELSELLDYGVDIFFNLNKYSDDRVEHNS